MIPNNKIFYNKNEIIYDGKLYSRLYRMIDSPGRYILHFEFISTNSDYEQCIGLSLLSLAGASLRECNFLKEQHDKSSM